jgi:hypothetical protein
MTFALRIGLLVGALLAGAPAEAQIFLASRPHPEFRLGPLLVRASVPRSLAAVTVDVQWSLEIPPTRSALELEQDLYLLWPGAVGGGLEGAKPDPALRKYVEARGFTTLAEGRLPLYAEGLYQLGPGKLMESVPGGAPFVTYVMTGGASGLTPPATYIRIPWTWKLVNRAWLMNLRMTADGLLQPKKATWVENAFRGPRHVFSITYNDVRPPAVFPMYFEHRDRLIRLADAPTELAVNFPDADHLKVDEVFPPSSTKRLSETLQSTEIVSFFLEKSEGVSPQQLTVQFGYFSGLQAWLPVLIPVLFFVLGKASGPLLSRLARGTARYIRARVQVGRSDEGPRPRESGIILSRDTLAQIIPGATTYDEVLRLCGPPGEQHEDFAAPDRRTLIYSGRRMIPQRHRRFGWFATVSQWGTEHQRVQIEIEGDRVRDLQAHVRRTNVAPPARRGRA